MTRRISRTDRLVSALDLGLRSIAAKPVASRPSPADEEPDAALSPRDRRRSARLMRVNRAGEISAQALYLGQQLAARNESTATHLEQAASDELDHLAWCNERLESLGGRASFLDPVFFLGSLAIGALAGLRGDSTSLGFVAETERQVEAHLGDHLRRLPAQDGKSRAVLRQMAADEARHGADASLAGAAPIREPVRSLMAVAGGILRKTALRL